MKKDPKSAAVVADERREANELAAEILRLTERIPQHVMNAPGVMAARMFKERITKARTVASATTKNLSKLRMAIQDVNHYYKAKA